jgi:hypothetical protein
MSVSHIKPSDRFGRLIVTSFSHRNKKRLFVWSCLCDCGNTHLVTSDALGSGKTRSCGCLMAEWRATLGERRKKTHRIIDSPLYRIWNTMHSRCGSTGSQSYPKYGGRGITVCDRWDSFELFQSDMGPRPSDQHQIDRIDNDGPYSPENCHWATRGQNTRNKRNNVWLTLNGETMILSDWAQRIGIGVCTLHHRIKVGGWSTERALTQPVKRK